MYEKVLSKIKFLAYHEKKSMNIYHCAEDAIVLVGLRVNEHSPLDLTSPDVLTQWNADNSSAVKVIKSERKYDKERGIEVFELLQNGCYITDENLFTTLLTMVKK